MVVLVVLVVLVMSDVFLVTVNVFFVSSPLFPLSTLSSSSTHDLFFSFFCWENDIVLVIRATGAHRGGDGPNQ